MIIIIIIIIIITIIRTVIFNISLFLYNLSTMALGAFLKRYKSKIQEVKRLQ